MTHEFITGMYNKSVCHNTKTGEIVEYRKEKEILYTSLGSIKMKHARVSPSIYQQVKIGNLSSTLRPTMSLHS